MSEAERKAKEWNTHRFKCPTCRKHVSIEGKVLRKDELCEAGHHLYIAFNALDDEGEGNAIE